METEEKRRRPTRRPKAVDPTFLETVALSYLNRFDATRASLRRMLHRRAQNEALKQPDGEATVDPEQLSCWIDALLDRYEASNLISDERFADTVTRSLREKGLSRRSIQAKLRQKGVGAELAEAALRTVDHGESAVEAELYAAIRLARRRRLGRYRRSEIAPDSAAAARRKDLAVLARGGFSYELACRALDTIPEEE